MKKKTKLFKSAAFAVCMSLVMSSVTMLAMADEKAEDYLGRTVDFSQLSGNCLIAVNPDPWVQTYVNGKQTIDDRGKMMGSLAFVPKGSEIITDKTRSAYDDHAPEESAHENYAGCATMRMNADIPAGVAQLNEAGQEKVTYKVGDVMLRYMGRDSLTPSMNEMEICGDEDVAVRVYQCVYAGEVSTVWGAVPIEHWSEAEMLRAVEISEDPKGNSLYGLMPEGSEDTARVTTVSGQNVQEIGENFDRYIKVEKEYTGDYLVTDQKYGDNDGKAAFLIEPFEPETLGFFTATDIITYWCGSSKLDCLHLNCNNMNAAKDPDTFYTTMLHELQHCIGYGYTEGNMDSWIDEWMAQDVSRLSYKSDSKDVRKYTQGVVNSYLDKEYREDGVLHTYAFGEQYPDDPDYDTIYIYNTAYLLGEYFRNHVNKDYIKLFTTQFNKCKAKDISEYLRKENGHSLEYYLACFDVALAANMDGTDAFASVTGSDFDLGDTWLVNFFRESRDKNRNEIEKSGVIKPVTQLSDNAQITGAGAALFYKAAKDCSFRLNNVQDGVIWALRDSKGEIVAVDGLEYYDDIALSQTLKINTTVRLSDGKEIPAKIDIGCRSALPFNGYKKYTFDDMGFYVALDVPDKSELILESNPVVKQRNFKSVYTISQNSSSDEMCPMVIGIKMRPVKGADKDSKKICAALNKAIKNELKTKPFRFGIRAMDVSKVKPTVTVNNKGRITKAVYLANNKKCRLKKTDCKLITNEAGEPIGIQGMGNYSGTYYFPDK